MNTDYLKLRWIAIEAFFNSEKNLLNYRSYITIDPNIRFGRPCKKGTRISVYDVLGWLSQGLTAQDIMEDFPELKYEQIMACLGYAADRERRIAY